MINDHKSMADMPPERQARMALAKAAALLKEIAASAIHAAVTTTHHDGFDWLQKSEHADTLAWALGCIKNKYGA
jgi:hypothetical protein